MLVEVNYIEY